MRNEASQARIGAEQSLRSVEQDLQAASERQAKVRNMRQEAQASGKVESSTESVRLKDLPDKGRFLDIRV